MTEQDIRTAETEAAATEQTAPEQPAAQEEDAEQTGKMIKRLKRAERSVRDYQYFIFRVLLLLLVLWLLLFQLMGVTHMPNGDMYPRIDSGDMVLFYRLDKDVKFQDIIVFEKRMPETGSKETMIGRVVAVGGDTVEITDSARPVINGNALVETNIFYPTPRYEGFTEYPLTLAADECFVLSDYRNGGTDSRYFGPVKKSEIAGTVISILRRNNL